MLLSDFAPPRRRRRHGDGVANTTDVCKNRLHTRPHPGDSGSAPALPKDRSPEKDRSGDAPEPPGE